MSISAHTQRRARYRKSPTISLFPFLAVLICTMGALVPLLLAMARQARLQALQEATVKAAQRQVDAQSERESAEWRIGELKTARRQAEERLNQARLALGHVESHARRLRQQADHLQETLRGLNDSGGTAAEDGAAIEESWRQLQDEIAEAEKQLAAAREAAAARPRSYAIIPYQGPNGTYRPPIYIECRADAIVLQPEGIALREPDFEEPIEADNPLAEALRAARETMLAQKQIGGDGTDEPYPLLLVRPDGIPAYYVARAALASWKSAVGYELVGKDWELEFPNPNPEVGRAMRAVVAEAREHRRRRAMLTAMLANAKSTDTWGTVLGTVSAGGPGGSAAPAAGNLSGAGGPRAPATAPVPVRGESPRSSGSRGGGGSAGEPRGTSPSGSVAAGSLESPLESPVSQFGASTFQGGPVGNGSARASQPGRSTDSRGLSSDGALGAAVFGGTKAASRDARVSYRAAPGGGLIREIDPEPTTSAALRRRVETSTAGSGRSPGEGSPRQPAETASEARAGRAVAMRPGEWIPEAARPPQTNHDSEDASKPADRKAKRLADSRGENWGLPNAARGSVGVTRPIRVRCSSNRLEILPDEPKADRRVIPLGERIEDTIDDFVSAVWEHMKGWGIAGRGMYWRPILRIEVTPDAEFRFEELRTLLDASGLIVERKS